MISGMNWYPSTKFDPRVVGLYARHYSSKVNGGTIPGWLRCGVAAPGESMTLMTTDCSALFLWLKQEYRADDQYGVNCAIFRNEGNRLSSDLIREAAVLAWSRWPGERLYTFVDPKEIKSTNPGYSFMAAGWHRLKERTTRGLVILELVPEAVTE